MELGRVGREGGHYSGGREDEEQYNSNRRPSLGLTPFSHLPPPSSSPSNSFSSPAGWSIAVPPEPSATTDDQPGSSVPADTALLGDRVEKEHMFDKVVTPSDVGKLNRLVIPKQHAEKYFPLDSSTNEKGLLLNFEDRNGKPWRFRYSYWNSSQSYVMTKGWSRFVKEKRLNAGDTVSFGRGVGEAGRDRLFIDWKRRPEAHHPPDIPRIPIHNPYTPMMSFARSAVPWGRFYTPPASVMEPASAAHDRHHIQGGGYAYGAANPYLYMRSTTVGGSSHSHHAVQVQYVGGSSSSSGGGAGSGKSPIVNDSVPVSHSTISSNSKRVRLFGVNLDCSPSTQEAAASPAEASEVRPHPPFLSLQPGDADADMVDSPSDDKRPMSLDLDI